MRTLQSCVFTSIDDDSFGEKFPGWSNPYIRASDGNPADDVYEDALKIWYVNYPTEVKSALIRWAQTGIEYFLTGPSADHTVRNCRFENITVRAISVHIDPARRVTFTGSEKCSVTANSYVSQGSVVGSLSVQPFCTDGAFLGINNTDEDNSGKPVADTMGAAGLNYFVETLNGRVAVFEKATGRRVRQATLSQFFGITVTGTNYPTGEAVDPRVVYDLRDGGRWYASALDPGSGQVLLAISNGLYPVPSGTGVDLSDLTWIANNWTKRLVNVADSRFEDFPMLGLDKFGVYIAIHVLDTSNGTWSQKIAAIPKPISAAQVQPANANNVIAVDIGGNFTIQPAANYDDPAQGETDYMAWFVARGPTQPNRPGKILYGRLKWNSGTGVFEKQGSWFASSDGLDIPSDLSYYDIPNTGSTSFVAPQAPSAMGSAGIELAMENQGGGTRLTMATMRNRRLWTCQTVGFNQSGGYTTLADRSGCVWFMLQVSTGQLPPVLNMTSSHGKIYDSAPASPYSYYYPSLAVNAAGDMVIGFSGSRSNEHIGAFYTGIKAGGGSLTRPVLVQAGRAYTRASTGPNVRWGDYSYTCPDPDGVRFWTVQEYAHSAETTVTFWGTAVTSIK